MIIERIQYPLGGVDKPVRRSGEEGKETGQFVAATDPDREKQSKDGYQRHLGQMPEGPQTAPEANEPKPSVAASDGAHHILDITA